MADRKLAISRGIKRLRSGDVLVVAGKGHETGQVFGAKVYPFDDVKTIKEILVNS